MHMNECNTLSKRTNELIRIKNFTFISRERKVFKEVFERHGILLKYPKERPKIPDRSFCPLKSFLFTIFPLINFRISKLLCLYFIKYCIHSHYNTDKFLSIISNISWPLKNIAHFHIDMSDEYKVR